MCDLESREGYKVERIDKVVRESLIEKIPVKQRFKNSTAAEERASRRGAQAPTLHVQGQLHEPLWLRYNGKRQRSERQSQ